MHPKDLSIADFTYTLPDAFIARYPLPVRDQSKLLLYRKAQISQDTYQNIADHLPSGSLLVFNNTRVVEARLLFQKENGSRIEIFCLEPHADYGDITSAMMQKGRVLWHCLVGGAKKWKEGSLVQEISFEKGDLLLNAKKIQRGVDDYLIELSWDKPELSFAEVLHIAGLIPLPPYLKREAESSDTERYQTIYAQIEGSVAAPTAGLHFTENLFQKLSEKNIAHDFVSLHVGAGTFKPVKAATMQSHEMHAEFMVISKAFLLNLLNRLQSPVIAVGTTSLRTLESIYWLGVKTILNPVIQAEALFVNQWEPYETNNPPISANDAIQALLDWMHHRQFSQLITKTQIIVAPGYVFRIIKGLITNFHQPQSTLLLLVAAITGEDWRKIYQYALDNDFRFLSYGDGSLLWLPESVMQ